MDGFVFRHRGGQCVHGAGVDQGFVALDVDIDVGRDMGGDFGDAVGASPVVGAGQNGFGPEGFDGGLDAVVFGGDEDARGQPGLTDALNDVLNHGLVSDGRERLTGKAVGSIARGDYYQDRRLVGIWHEGCSPFASAGILTSIIGAKALNSARLGQLRSYIEVTHGACFGDRQ